MKRIAYCSLPSCQDSENYAKHLFMHQREQDFHLGLGAEVIPV
jgi:hypothetical protein